MLVFNAVVLMYTTEQVAGIFGDWLAAKLASVKLALAVIYSANRLVGKRFTLVALENASRVITLVEGSVKAPEIPIPSDLYSVHETNALKSAFVFENDGRAIKMNLVLSAETIVSNKELLFVNELQVSK